MAGLQVLRLLSDTSVTNMREMGRMMTRPVQIEVIETLDEEGRKKRGGHDQTERQESIRKPKNWLAGHPEGAILPGSEITRLLITRCTGNLDCDNLAGGSQKYMTMTEPTHLCNK